MSISFLTKKVAKWSLYAVVILIIVSPQRDSLRLNVAERAAAPYTYDVIRWHFSNSFSKWVHRAVSALPWNLESPDVRLNQVSEYFALGEEANRLSADLDEAVARISSDLAVAGLEKDLRLIANRRLRLRNDVEETIEGIISGVIGDEGLTTLFNFVLPPVDIRLTQPPRLLVTSPRDRISRTHDVLLSSDIEISERQEVEDELLREENLSALVINIGGIATYPASLPDNQPLQWTLRTASHEWLHHYLFFRPLGQHMFDNEETQVLNETVADIAGRELGDRAFELLGGTTETLLPRTGTEPMNTVVESNDEATEFDFDRDMRITRLRVDELLAAGLIEAAEVYMEERRTLFVENGFAIRKLNQAYFAFYGTYADGPASVSPIGGQLKRFRELMPDVGTFVKAVARFSSYDDFLHRLDALEATADVP